MIRNPKAAAAKLTALLFVFFLSFRPGFAEEVKIEHQGLEVIGNLGMAPGKTLKADGVVLLLHDSLGHHRMDFIATLQEVLQERGINSLAITLSLGLNGRRGMFDCSIEQDHRNEDAREEIGTWIAWLREKGAGGITLAGHGRGGTQIAYYVANNPDKLVRKAVLIAPLAHTVGGAGSEYDERFRRPLQPVLAEAEKLTGEDQPNALLANVGFVMCPQARVTAGAFINYYGQNPNLYTPSLIPNIKLPVLIAVGDRDPLEAELSAAIQGIPTSTSHVSFAVIPGADSAFRDLAADALGDRIKAFAQQK